MKPVVIIPVLNEVLNIGNLIERILSQMDNLDIIVVDGGSDDGTQNVLDEWVNKTTRLSVISQGEKLGFGKGLSLGFELALQKGYDPIITMDGDNSHNPKYLSNLLETSKEYDLVMCSRYINGVRVDGWRFRKLLMSKLANMLVSYVLIKPIWDFTSGYRCYRKKCFENIDLKNLPSKAYIIQIQLLHLAYKNRFSVKEIPFLFRGDKFAQSKVAEGSKLKTLLYLYKFRAPISEIFRHLFYLKKDYARFVDEYEELINPPNLRSCTEYDLNEGSTISVGVLAHNEEKIIVDCLKALQNQTLKRNRIKEIVVVSSGSTDGTNQIIRYFQEQDDRIRLILQPERLGKASAINKFLAEAKGDIAVIESADTIPAENAIAELILPFSDSDVGICGAHPVPVNNRNSFVGFCVNRLWELHHHMSLKSPKCGEMVAFRNIIKKIPKFTAVDEAVIEGIFHRHNKKLAYADKAIVYNKGPETIKDFIRQRRRIASGHRHLKVTTHYEVSTNKPGNIISHVMATQRWTPREMFYMVLLMVIEAYSRLMGMIDFYLRDKNPYIWDISETTKEIK